MFGDQPLRDHRLELVIENVDAIDFAARVALDQVRAQRGSKTMLDLAEDADVFADDLHAAGTRRKSFTSRLPGRGARRSILRNVVLWCRRIAAAHEITALPADALDVNILLGL